MNQKVLLTFFIIISLETYAQNKNADSAGLKPVMKVHVPAKAIKQPKGENLLDFEAEIIEGEKKRPELFLDIKAGDGNVGSGLYMRPNYDDFFVVDKKRRPRFIKSK